MNWPQYTYIALSLISLGMVFATHGQPRTPENAWNTVIASAIAYFLLYQGGFFKGIGA